MRTIVSVCSARPNFVKLAAVHHALWEAASSELRHVIVHTGQHYDPLFSDIFFEQLQIPAPAVNLDVHGGSRDEVIDRTESAFAAVLPSLKPDAVLVYGDVNGAVGAARATKNAKYLLGHVEAGLRSFDEEMPEEHNRIAIDGLADLLFCSEPSGMENLKREGVEGKTHLVGNTMIDTLIRMQPHIETAELPKDLPDRYAIVTMHRPSNVDSDAAVKRNVDFLCELGQRVQLLLPLHHRFHDALEKRSLLQKLERSVRVLPPLGYLPFLRLLRGSQFILTDSGGIQEEAAFLRKRCFTLRKNTERPITIESGSNVLVDLEKSKDGAMLLEAAKQDLRPSVTVPSLWDGKAGSRIISLLSSACAF